MTTSFPSGTDASPCVQAVFRGREGGLSGSSRLCPEASVPGGEPATVDILEREECLPGSSSERFLDEFCRNERPPAGNH
jgi:hypothetical protein